MKTESAARAPTALIEGLLDRSERSRFAGIEAPRRELMVGIALDDLARAVELEGDEAVRDALRRRLE